MHLLLEDARGRGFASMGFSSESLTSGPTVAALV